jgi:hypothetical protein
MSPYILAWIIGAANPMSALLVGPALGRKIGERRARRAQGVGWALLAISQVTFLAFGFASKLDGFRYAQPLMIPIAAFNFYVWWCAGRNRSGGPGGKLVSLRQPPRARRRLPAKEARPA